MGTTQTQFRDALLNPAAPVPDGLVDGAGAPTVKRFAVYRNNVTVALVEALRSTFPVLLKLLGDQNFDQLARLFARQHPPDSPLMMQYGAEMPLFLQGFEPLRHIGYLPDVARLELALHRSYHAADCTAFDPGELAALSPDVLMRSTLTLAPAVEVVRSPWPLFDIWRFNTVDGAEKPRAVAQGVLITRAAFDPVPHAVTPADAAWLRAIAAGDTIGAAMDAATEEDADFDLSPLLTVLVQHGAITTLTPPKAPPKE